MKLKVLASGSSGNCYILSSPTGSLLLEVGIPWREIQKGLGFDLFRVEGCISTHEHKDHSKSIVDVMKAGINVYTIIDVANSLKISGHRLHIIEPLKQFELGEYKILAFPIEHDVNGVGFLIRNNGFRVLFLTDSYYCKYRFDGLNVIMIECNYIKETLDANIEAGYINEAMKPRLLQSHFSLEHVKEFLLANDLSECRKIILLHLSDLNSDAARMVREIEKLTGINTVVADAGLEIELERYPY